MDFANFIKKRFEVTTDDTITTAEQESLKPASIPSDEAPISDTPANKTFMDRFCRVN